MIPDHIPDVPTPDRYDPDWFLSQLTGRPADEVRRSIADAPPQSAPRTKKPAPKSKAAPKPKPEADPAPKPEPKPDPIPDLKPDLKQKPAPKPAPDPDPNPDPAASNPGDLERADQEWFVQSDSASGTRRRPGFSALGGAALLFVATAASSAVGMSLNHDQFVQGSAFVDPTPPTAAPSAPVPDSTPTDASSP